VNAYRTAAADAAAATVLARPDSSTLTIFGTGHQALFECLALSRVLPIKDVLIVARNLVKAEQFATKLKECGLDALVATSAQKACMQVDIVVTATPARALFSRLPGFDLVHTLLAWEQIRRASKKYHHCYTLLPACSATCQCNPVRLGSSNMSHPQSKSSLSAMC
jgi:ornithine cyclodeaminase/alanine dehydrogenase-like protein (mu-crystallin family)